MIKLNLGCGSKKLNGFSNCDNNKSVKPDKFLDVDHFPYSFPRNYADYILLDNVLEHLENIPSVMKELHRILKPNGRLEIFVPYAKSDGAIQDPTHTHFFTENSLQYFETKSSYLYSSPYTFTILVSKLENANKTRLSKLRSIIPFKHMLRYILFNMFDQVHFVLKPDK